MSIWIPPDSDFARSLSEPNFATPNKKPTGAVRIDWNHPLTRGLVRAVVSGNQELVRNIPIENSGVELTANKFGPEYLYDIGSNDSLVLGESPVSGSQPRTVLSAYRNVDADATYSTLCSIDNGGAGSTAQRWTAWISSGFFRVEIQGTGYTSTLAVDNADNEQTFWGVRQAGSNLSSTTVYINNQSETLTGTTTINTNASYILRVGQTRTDFTDRSLSGGLLWFYFWDRALSELEIAEIKRNPYQILKPANDTPYMFTVAGGGGVSGAGDLVGAGSEITGTGERTVTGTGALEGQGAEVVGTATRTITGTGALVGQGSDVAGSGAAGGTHTGTGDLVGAGSEIVGVGERTVTGTGELVAQGSEVVGVGERIVTGSGDLVGAGAEVSGSGAIGGITTGTGDLVGVGSEIVGTGLRTVTGSGALVAQGSAVAGTGERTVTGAGALVGSGSDIVGAGVGGDVTTGAGALVGHGSAVTGTGTRTITGVGELVAAGSIIVGSGLRTITGSGALVGAGSEIVGSYVATIIEPSLFQSAADTIIDVFAAAHGQTITLALDSGTVTITGFMRKRPKDWNTPDGKMRGSGWQIVCKGWEISTSDLEGMSGKRATVDGAAYYIVSATPKTSGTLVLDVGYANA